MKRRAPSSKPRPTRDYSLFVKFDDKWRRISEFATDLRRARLLYQHPLLSGTEVGMTVALRPVADSWVSGKPSKRLSPSYDQEAKAKFLRAVGAPGPNGPVEGLRRDS